MSIEEIRHNIKFFAEPTDWIAQVDDDYLTVVAKRCYLVNEKLAKQCKEYGYDLMNTSTGGDRIKALNELFNKLLLVRGPKSTEESTISSTH